MKSHEWVSHNNDQKPPMKTTDETDELGVQHQGKQSQASTLIIVVYRAMCAVHYNSSTNDRRQSYLSFFLEENDGMRKPRFFFFFSGVASVAVGEAADT